jgi:hypothetical protein
VVGVILQKALECGRAFYRREIWLIWLYVEVEMSSYIDKDFIPPREFWSAFVLDNKCSKCGFGMNGSTYKWELLRGPKECRCKKCGFEWLIAIPLGDSPARSDIEKLLLDEKRFYQLRDELRVVIDRLKGRNKVVEQGNKKPARHF